MQPPSNPLLCYIPLKNYVCVVKESHTITTNNSKNVLFTTRAIPAILQFLS